MQRDGQRLVIAEQTYNLSIYQKVYLVGAGKAAAQMACAAASILGPSLERGLVIAKEGYVGDLCGKAPANLQILEAAHPIPDQRGLEGTRHILEMLKSVTREDLLVVILSGGGSALLVSPVEGISLSDLQDLTSAMLTRGATINEINAIRKHLDIVKGGGLARLANGATIVTLILSDVVGDPLDVIASGPTVPDSSTYHEAYTVLETADLLDTVPPAILSRLHCGMRGELSETPKADDPIFQRVQNVIIGSNRQAAQAAMAHAQKEGLLSMVLTTYLQGEARYAGRTLAAIARQMHAWEEPLPRPGCLICGGETTVNVYGSGEGGRNQEMALGAVTEMAGLQDVVLITLATDGGDGPTDAAGAVVTGETLARARLLGMNPARYLARNDSYHFFDALDDLLKPGPTQTNVNDLAFLFSF
jgi:hydroxypyruvate reductase